jgi:hypothetical protein
MGSRVRGSSNRWTKSLSASVGWRSLRHGSKRSSDSSSSLCSVRSGKLSCSAADGATRTRTPYSRMKADAAARGDDDDAAACERFAHALGRANLLMQRRHHVLHAIWTADPDVVTLDGASTAFRSRGQRDGADWSLADLWNLANDLNDLHQEALAELARQIGAQSSARSE